MAHESGLRQLPRWAQFLIAALFDAIDIGIRLFLWPFFLLFPMFAHPARTTLDVVLTILALRLWGSAGLIHASEIAFGWMPVIGFAIDLVPMLTVAGIIEWLLSLRYEGGEAQTHTPPETTSTTQERSLPMIEIVWGLGGFVLWGILYWLGVVPGSWFWLMTLGAAGMRFALRLASIILIPSTVFIAIALPIGIFLMADLIALGVFKFALGPEDYREMAWHELKRQGDLRIGIAEKADATGEKLGLKDISEAAKREGETLIQYGRGKVADALESGESTGIPVLDDATKLLGRLVRPKPVEQAPAGTKTEERIGEVDRTKQDAVRLGLGWVQTALYRSDFPLERAEQIRSRRTSPLRTLAMIVGGIFGFLMLFRVRQDRTLRPQRRITPTIPFDF